MKETTWRRLTCITLCEKTRPPKLRAALSHFCDILKR